MRSHLAVRLYGTPLLIARPKLDVILSVPGSRIGLPDLEENADSILASFRNDCHPRIAITVDMIATGTDVKPLEVLLFMRDVRSRDYYEQMKDHGITRSEDTLLPEEIEAARAQRVAAACAPFDNPALRDEIDNAHRERLIDHIKQHKDEIAAIGFFIPAALSAPGADLRHARRPARPPRPPAADAHHRTPVERLRPRAGHQVKGSNSKRQLTDLMSLLRLALGLDTASCSSFPPARE